MYLGCAFDFATAVLRREAADADFGGAFLFGGIVMFAVGSCELSDSSLRSSVGCGAVTGSCAARRNRGMREAELR